MKTEQFKGNGAECMVRFIADGCKGTIRKRNGETYMSAKHWANETDGYREDWGIVWLGEPCTYTPPEPVYRNATPGEALDAWLAGRTIQRRANADDSVANGEWYDIGAKYSDMPFSRWSGTETEYRIKEE